MVSSHKDHKIRVFDVSEGRCVARMEGHARTPFCIKVHPERPNVLASACYDGCVKLWVWGGGEQSIQDRGEMVFHTPTAEQRVLGGAVSSINFVVGASSEEDAVLITCAGQVLYWRYGVPGAQAQPLNYSDREADQKVALARIVKLQGRALLLVARWNMSNTLPPPKAHLTAYVEDGSGAFVTTEIKFENVVMFWEAGVAIRGSLVAFCEQNPEDTDPATYLVIVNLDVSDGRPFEVLHRKKLTLLSGQQGTSLDFSGCGSYLLLSLSRPQEQNADTTQYPVAHVYRSVDCKQLLVHRSSNHDDNCSNGARFLAGTEPAFVYGTVKGRVVLVGETGPEEGPPQGVGS